jgi:hypothetical protein
MNSLSVGFTLEEQYTVARENMRNALKGCGKLYLSTRPDQGAFADATESEKHFQIRSINNWADIVSSFVMAGGQPENTKDLIRYYFSRVGLRTPLEFTDQIMSSDVVEIYDCSGKRLFFSPHLFDYSSYSPEQLFSEKFWVLYSRDESITNKIIDYTIGVAKGELKKPFDPDFGKHVVSETRSESRFSVEMHFKKFSPVFYGENVAGIACCSALRLLQN